MIKQFACIEHGLVGPHVALDFLACVLIGTLVTLPQVVLDFPACVKGSLHLGYCYFTTRGIGLSGV